MATTLSTMVGWVKTELIFDVICAKAKLVSFAKVLSYWAIRPVWPMSLKFSVLSVSLNEFHSPFALKCVKNVQT